MPLIRPVLMLDGTVRRNHVIYCIEHLVSQSTTLVHVESFGDDLPSVYHTTGYPLTLGMSLEDAYTLISENPFYKEYFDDAQAAIDALMPTLTDEQAEMVTNVFPDWECGHLYAVGDRCKYGAKLYRCVQAHTSKTGWEPPVAASLWTRTSADPDVIDDWIQPTGAQDAYHLGDKVRHNNESWISTVDANVWEPGVYGWQMIIGGE